MKNLTIWVGNKLVCNFCRYLNNTSLNRPTIISNIRKFSADAITNENFKLFFNSEVQTILKNLTGFDMHKVLSKRKLGDKLEPPQYKFMTSEQVQQEIEKSQKLAEEMLQMPPVVPVRKEINVVISRDPELTGQDTAKHVFTDISFGKTDRTRTIVVRDLDGTLRKAYWSERRYANQTYFPRPGREFRVPKMFQPEYLKPILDRGDYIFVLDRACVEFDADDPEYHRVTQATYNAIEERHSYGTLRFTRHFGPMVFYYVLNKMIDNLLLENLGCERLGDAAELVTLYYIVHPSASSVGKKCQPGQEVQFIKEYIDKDSKMKVALDLALLPYNKQQEPVQAVTS